MFLGFFFLLLLFLLFCCIVHLKELVCFPFIYFFESRLIPTLFLILGWGYQPERVQAGIYLLFIIFSGTLRNIDLQFATNVWNSLFVQSSLWCWPPYP
jgi:NADH-ubiquinone oxidoreductase chain 4